MFSVGNARRNARMHIPPATRRRALELLAASRDGATEAIMLAHGFSIDMLVELIRAGLATATAERVVAGGRTMCGSRRPAAGRSGQRGRERAASQTRHGLAPVRRAGGSEEGNAMVQATEVFTPTDVPTLTYVERASRNFEADLRNAFNIPKMIVSISGPSKSGKTVLVTKVVALENLIHIYGASIKTPGDLWSNVLTWMGGPIERTETAGSTIGGELSATAGGRGGIPVIAEAKANIKGGVSVDSSTSTAKKYSTTGLDAIVREIGESDYVVFIDDFHYIERNVQEEIGRQIKPAAEKGIRICTASVPHRSDDVVRSNTELRGRVTAIDMSYWSANELEQIAFRGFRELNVDLAPAVIRALANEAFGSPQLMQAISLNFCFERGINETQGTYQRIEIDSNALRQIFERTSVVTDYSTMLNALHAGPKQRGTERKQFNFTE
jgi:hypothetical protein